MARILKGSASAATAVVLADVDQLPLPERRDGLGGELGRQLARAQREGHTEGHAQGFAVGLEEGRTAGRAEAMEAFTTMLRPALGALEEARRQLLARDAVRVEELEGELVGIAVEVARALLGRELMAVDRPVLDAVRRALAMAPERGDVLVRLHPDDVAVVQAAPTAAPGRGVELVADPAVEPGGCIVDVGACTVDGQLGTALERVRDALGLTDGRGNR